MDREEWKPVVGFEKYYEVSNFGRVRSFDRRVRVGHGAHRIMRGKILRLNLNRRGYLRCNVGVRQRFKTREVHRLVAISFIPKRHGRRFVNHKNGVKTDNRVGNLEWVTKHEDNQHAQDTGLNKSRFSMKQKMAARKNLLLTQSHIKHNEKYVA